MTSLVIWLAIARQKFLWLLNATIQLRVTADCARMGIALRCAWCVACARSTLLSSVNCFYGFGHWTPTPVEGEARHTTHMLFCLRIRFVVGIFSAPIGSRKKWWNKLVAFHQESPYFRMANILPQILRLNRFVLNSVRPHMNLLIGGGERYMYSMFVFYLCGISRSFSY